MSNVLISFIAVLLFTYWFRYTCGIILRANYDEAAAGNLARANHLNFPDIRAKLRSQARDLALAPLYHLVERDYQFVRFLVRNTTDLGTETLETRIVMLDYHLMQLWYLLMMRLSQSQARKALDEMNGIVSYLAQRINARSASFLEA